MDPATPKQNIVPLQVQSSPVFFTGLSTTTSQPVPTSLCVLCNANLPQTAKSRDLCSDCKEIPYEISSSIIPSATSSHRPAENLNVTPSKSQESLGNMNLLGSLEFNSDQLSDTVKSAMNSLRNMDKKILENLLESSGTKDRTAKSESSWKERNGIRSKAAPYQPPHRDFDKRQFSSPSFQSPAYRNGQFQQEGNNIQHPTINFTPPLLHSNFSAPTPISYQQLSQDIWRFFHEKKQTEEVRQKKMVLRTKLHEILLTRFPKCALYVVGSSMTGLGASSSDMDMCLMLTDDEINQQNQATVILRSVRNLFQKYKFLINIELIYAKVPILKFKDSVSGVEVDLNINNSVGIRNTQLLSSYSRIDERLPPLIVLTKLWARHNGINDAKNNSLSSYSIVLMVIHYLQFRCRPPVLPCLQQMQPEKFHLDTDVRNLTPNEELPFFRSENINDLGDLFVGFLKYYSNEFDYNKVMSVRLGRVINKKMAMSTLSPNNKKAHWNILGIEEPFDLTNTARAVFREDIFDYVINVFTQSWNRLRSNPSLDSLFC